jgi:two-component sensor histidine kinase/PAS domain-containing protein
LTVDPAETLSPAELRRLLNEAEETLRAIRDGEADAFVMREANDDKVLALGGGDEAYRAIMEAMDLGAVALDGAGNPLYANGALGDLLDCDAGDLQARGLWAFLDPVCAALIREAIGAGAAASGDAGRASHHRIQFAQAIHGRIRHLAITVAPLPLAFGAGSVVTFTDISARVEADLASESARIARAVISSANQAVVVCDMAGRVINANGAAAALIGAEPLGRRFEEAFPLILPANGPTLFADDLVRMATEGHPSQTLEAGVQRGDSWTDLLVSAAPLRLAGEQVGGCVITLLDNSERKAHEKRQSLLLRELDHRVKNSLAVVMSIASRTSAHATDLADFRTRFNSRIQALAATHVLLAESEWSGLKLSSLVKRELAAFTASAGPRLDMAGLDHEVSPDVGIAFGMVIHELATNAVKYGALSVERGTVSVHGESIDGPEGGKGPLRVTWTERGGPAVMPPDRPGFGQTLISRSLSRGNGGGATVSFDPAGMVCVMTVPRA